MDVVVDTRMSVHLGNNYANEVEGLCGNNNGISSDDIGAETSLDTSLVDEASAWKTIPSCPEPDLQTPTDPCEVCFSETYSKLNGTSVKTDRFIRSFCHNLNL